MSIRIHTAIGYAMPFLDFARLTLLKFDPEECFVEQTEDVLAGYKHLQYGGDCRITRLVNPIITDKHSVDTLMMVVGSGDEREHVLFWPSRAIKEKWYRYDDDMDWFFARAGRASDDYDGNDLIEYVNECIPPYYNTRMDRNGVPVSIERGQDLHEYNSDPNLVPGVPVALRWWLMHCGVLSIEGVGALRPMRARWWG